MATRETRPLLADLLLRALGHHLRVLRAYPVPSVITELDFRAVREPEPGPRWQGLFDEFWPAYERWFRKEGDSARPSYLACARAMRTYLPKLVPAWEALVDLAGGGDASARFLSQWRPPAIIAACSQALWTRGEDVALVHNYDYAPRLCDGIVLLSAWTRPRVIATTDCLIGALDGMNEDGLAIALAFGGRPAVGEGFAAPMIVRGVLETCATTADAVRMLERVPVYMTYTFAVLDRAGHGATVHAAPDRPAVVTDARSSTNHQQGVEWPRYARATDTVRRAEHLRACLEGWGRGRAGRDAGRAGGALPRAAALPSRARPRIGHALHARVRAEEGRGRAPLARRVVAPDVRRLRGADAGGCLLDHRGGTEGTESARRGSAKHEGIKRRARKPLFAAGSVPAPCLRASVDD